MTNTEQLFQMLDTTSEMIQKEDSVTYLEALAETGENLFQRSVLQPYGPELKQQLEDTYHAIDLEQMKAEEIRKAFQLAVLRGMKEATQPNHEMTPDAVALFVGYLVNKVTEKKKAFSLLDPAVGAGNLLTAVLNGLKQSTLNFAVDADDLLLRLAYVNANLQKHRTEFFHQDSLQPLLVDPVDVVICDLPIGYYPNEEMASRYTLKSENSHSFAHHLMIEQSINHTKDGGFLFFLIPNGLFQSNQAKALNRFIREHAMIQGVLQLPLSMFKKEQHAKSIFMIRKKAEGIQPPSQALLANLPSFSKQQALQKAVQQIDVWFEQNRQAAQFE